MIIFFIKMNLPVVRSAFAYSGHYIDGRKIRIGESLRKMYSGNLIRGEFRELTVALISYYLIRA